MIHAVNRCYRGKFTRPDCYIERYGQNWYWHRLPDGTATPVAVTDDDVEAWTLAGDWRDITPELLEGAT